MIKEIETRDQHKLIIGEMGRGLKSITVSAKEFKKELAPKNALIQYREINGDKVVTITYRV
ncbi:hypothetical protein [Neobacillus sp.]|jgi:hypothetical protein|uniref:hypothetical protein n=1 Tax=Neobacillus sp. TaxID=2675273 RepID=UPI0035B53599